MDYITDFPPAPPQLHFDEIPVRGQNVLVQLMNGKKTRGKLETINSALEKIVLVPNGQDKRISAGFSDIRYVLFLPQHHIQLEEQPDINNILPQEQAGRNRQKFKIEFRDKKVSSGHVSAYVVDNAGLHLFKTSEINELFRIFIPSKSVSSYSIGPLLGEVLQKKGLTDKKNIEQALKQQMQSRTTGIDDEVVYRDELHSEKKPGDRVGEILEKNGNISDEDLHRAIAVKFGTPYLNLSHFDIDTKLVDYIPADIARKYLLIPVRKERNHITIAMEDPTDVEAINIVQFITGLQPEIVVSSRKNIESALNYLYDPLQEEPVPVEMKTVTEDETSDFQKLGEQKPIVRLANNIIIEAIRRNASDIHIRPGDKSIELLFRIDGSMIKIRDFPGSMLPALVSRIKILGNLDISERRVPQDGRTRVVTKDNVIDLRISIIPTINGESVVIRLLNTKLGMKKLEELNFSTDDSNILRNHLHKMHGLILVTGPTGSGKSTTLYAALHEVMGRELNIITVEDPVEYHIGGIEQVQVNTTTGLTFARILRNILRHDPDIIMIGEIRDEETARIAIQSSLTGHMVLSTLHTNSAVGAITRLKDMNIEPYLIAPTLLCVVAQRLLRCICPHCLEQEKVTPEIRKALNLGADETFYTGRGCDNCNQTGFSDRTVVYELLTINKDIKEIIKNSDSEATLNEVALNSGMVSLTQNALMRARQGRIPVSEVFRISQEN